MPERLGIMTDTQAIDVTFDFKGTRVRCGSIDYQMSFAFQMITVCYVKI